MRLICKWLCIKIISVFLPITESHRNYFRCKSIVGGLQISSTCENQGHMLRCDRAPYLFASLPSINTDIRWVLTGSYRLTNAMRNDIQTYACVGYFCHLVFFLLISTSTGDSKCACFAQCSEVHLFFSPIPKNKTTQEAVCVTPHVLQRPPSY